MHADRDPKPANTAIRAARAGDQAYIAKTLLLGMQTAGGGLPRSELNALVDRILDDRATRVVVACDDANTDRIAGFAIVTPMPAMTALHWIYVRGARRREGIAHALAAHAKLHAKPIVYTLEGESSAWLRAKFPRAIAMPITEVIR